MSDNPGVLTDQEVAALLADMPDRAMPEAVWQRLEQVLADDACSRAAAGECQRTPVRPRLQTKQIAPATERAPR